jgi:hypothetical protein
MGFGVGVFGDSPAYFLAGLATALILAATWGLSTQYFAAYMPYFYARNLKVPVFRGAGYALAVAVALAILPPARNSLWVWVSGASVERALRLHRWMAWLVVLFTGLHGIGLGAAYAGKYGSGFLFRWDTSTSVNVLAGAICGFTVLIMVLLALEPVGRRAYGLFVAGHLLWPLLIVFAFLHTRGSSETNSVYPMLAGVLLLAIDYVFRIFDGCCRRATVRYACMLPRDDGKHDEACLWLSKRMAAPHPGSFVYLWIPSISRIAHPFSVSSPPEPGAGVAAGSAGAVGRAGVLAQLGAVLRGAFEHRDTLHIKVTHPTTFTGKLVARIAAVAPQAELLDGDTDGAGSEVAARSYASGAPTDLPLAAAADVALRMEREQAAAAGPAGTGGALTDAQVAEQAAARDAAVAVATVSSAPGVLRRFLEAAGVQQPGSKPASSNAMPTGLQPATTTRTPAAVPRSLPRVYVFGPFSRLSMQIDRYAHVLLVAGGIGITPIASLHYSLLQRAEAAASAADAGNDSGAAGGTAESGRSVATQPPPLRSLTTIWCVRGIGLVNEFTPLLAPQPALRSAAVVAAGAPPPSVAVGLQAAHPTAPQPGLAERQTARPTVLPPSAPAAALGANHRIEQASAPVTSSGLRCRGRGPSGEGIQPASPASPAAQGTTAAAGGANATGCASAAALGATAVTALPLSVAPAADGTGAGVRQASGFRFDLRIHCTCGACGRHSHERNSAEGAAAGASSAAARSGTGKSGASAAAAIPTQPSHGNLAAPMLASQWAADAESKASPGGAMLSPALLALPQAAAPASDAVGFPASGAAAPQQPGALPMPASPAPSAQTARSGRAPSLASASGRGAGSAHAHAASRANDKRGIHARARSSTAEAIHAVDAHGAPFLRRGRPDIAHAMADIAAAASGAHSGAASANPAPATAAEASVSAAGAGCTGAAKEKHRAPPRQVAVAVIVCGPSPLVTEVVVCCRRASTAACRFDVHMETFKL